MLRIQERIKIRAGCI